MTVTGLKITIHVIVTDRGVTMYIRDLFANKKPVLSLEIFPPKKESPIEVIYETIQGLQDLRPDFISVTYGAGGSNTKRTVEIASLLKNKYGIEALAHLTCIASTKEQINLIITELEQQGIENILALRGDMPTDPDFEFPNPLHFRYAQDLTAYLKEHSSVCIGGACYPEGHIEASSMEADIQFLAEKVAAGAEFLITQLFFDNELFYRFMELARDKGITVPISAGIMPVLNRKQIERITSLSGASLPKKFQRMLEKYEHNPEALKEAGIAYATEQIIDLLSWGVDGIHLYTMNKPEVARKIVGNISSIRSYLNC